MKPNINNPNYDTMTYRIFCETLERLTTNDDKTAEHCYCASNEYLSEYMRDMDLTNKKVATVGSSGDQFFSALLQGSKDITIIDGNPYARVFIEYKAAMFANLTFEEMKKAISSAQMFHWSIYSKISHSLSTKSKHFWDTLMLELRDTVDPLTDQFDVNKLARQLIHPEVVFLCDFYKNEETYLSLQDLLRKHNFKTKFITSNLYDFPTALPEKYDLIMLSNIFAYHGVGDARYYFEKTIEDLYNTKLLEGGTIQVHYSFRKHYRSIDPEDIAGHPLRIKELGTYPELKTAYFIDKQSSDSRAL